MRLLSLTDEREYHVWAAGIADIADSAIRIGLAKAKDFTGFLSLGAFRELCQVQPEDFGLPTAHEAMTEACCVQGPWAEHQWSHPAVYFAAQAVGWFDMRNLTTKELQPLFSYHYEILCRRVIAGEKLEVPMPTALPAKSEIPLSPEELAARRERGAAALRKLREMFP